MSKKIKQSIGVFLVIASVLRGLFPAFFSNINSKIFYLILFGIFSSICLIPVFCKTIRKNLPYKIFLPLLFNLSVFSFWFFVEIASNFNLETVQTFIVYAIFPFSIYYFASLEQNKAHILFIIIFIILSGSVIFEYYCLNYFDGKYSDLISLINSKIRSSNDSYVTHVDKVFRANGITGNLHDSGNLLSLLTVYFFGLAFIDRSNKNFFLFFLSIGSLCMTKSVSNIVASFVGILAIVLTLFSLKSFTKTVVQIFLYIILFGAIFSLNESFFTKIFKWTFKITSKYEWDLMISIPWENSFKEILGLIFGHSELFNFSKAGYYSEIAFLKMIFTFGCLTCIFLFYFLLQPFFIYFKTKKINKLAFVYCSVVGTGIISLWHYGSLFRTTNIFLFLCFYSFAIKECFCLSQKHEFKKTCY